MRQSYKATSAEAIVKNEAIQTQKGITSLVNQLQMLFYSIVGYFSSKSKPRKVILIGQSSYFEKLLRFFNSDKSNSYQLLKCFPMRNDLKMTPEDIAEIKRFCLENQVEEIFFSSTKPNNELIAALSNFADKNFKYLRIATDARAIKKNAKNVNTYYFDDVPVMAVRKEPLAKQFNQISKRAFDIVFSLMALAFLVPFVFPIIALAIKLESRGPIFFVQKRPGKRNQLFNCFKFRSMTVNNNSEQQATKNDARITKVGAFIRKTSLDELPQFINVLLGDMSVVGPRPNMVKQLEYYSQYIDNYSFRHFVTPGITGLAQVKGFRGETQTLDLMEKRVELDIEYIEKWSLWLDIKIVFLTVYNMVKGEENAY